MAVETLLLCAEPDNGDDLATAIGSSNNANGVSTAPGSAVSLLQHLAPDDLQVLYDGCFDSAASVRKQACTSLTNILLKYPRDPILQQVSPPLTYLSWPLLSDLSLYTICYLLHIIASCRPRSHFLLYHISNHPHSMSFF